LIRLIDYHSEDLAISLAAGAGVRYPYSVEISGKPVNATVRVYGLYKVIKDSNPAADQLALRVIGGPVFLLGGILICGPKLVLKY
jgi:hypothetical protein